MPGKVLRIQAPQRRQVCIASCSVVLFGDETGAAWQHVSAENLTDVGARVRHERIEADPRVEFLEKPGEPDPYIVVLHLIGRQVDQVGKTGQL